MSNNNPLGYDTLKLRAVFIPYGNPNNVSTADITNHLGDDSLRIRAVFIPDGNPNNVSPADITNWLGHDVVKVRYVWNGSGESQPGQEQEQEPPADGPDGGERAGGPNQGTDGAGFTPIRQPAGPAMPPPPTLVQAARYVDPAKTAAAAWRAIAALSPPSQPTVSRGGDGQGGTVARPEAGSGETVGSSEVDAYVGNDPLNGATPTRLIGHFGSGSVQAGLQGKLASGFGSIVQAATEPEEENRGLLEEFINPLEPLLETQYTSVMQQVHALNPAYQVLTAQGHTIGQADVDAAYDALNETIDNVAREIAGGHASGGSGDLEFEGLINLTIRNPTESAALSNGRSYYYSKINGFVVIVNPGAVDSGTAFPVSNWPAYKATLR